MNTIKRGDDFFGWEAPTLSEVRNGRRARS